MAIINIQDIRNKYPSYDDLSDQELADKIHLKFYSDMPVNDFYDKVGLSKQNTQNNLSGLESILRTQSTPIDNIMDVLSGVAKGGENVARLGFGDKVAEAAQTENPNPLLHGMGEYLPYAIGGGTSLLGQLGAGALSGYVNTMPQEENLGGLLPSGRAGGAIEGIVLNALTEGTFKGLEALRPNKLFRGSYSPEQLQKNLIASSQTPTGLGDVVGSPFLKRQYENIISKFPLSGATEKFQEAGKAVVNKGEQVLSDILGVNEPENVSDQINNALTKEFELHQTTKNKGYEKFNLIGDEKGYKPKLDNFTRVLKENKDTLGNISLLGGKPLDKALFEKVVDSTGILKNTKMQSVTRQYEIPSEQVARDPLTGQPLEVQPTDRITQSQYASHREQFTPLGASGLPIKYEPSYSESNILGGALNRAARFAEHSPDPSQRNLAGVYKDLGKALKLDVKQSASATEDASFINALNQAEEHYEKNFSPFLDKEIYKYLSGAKDQDTLVHHFVKTARGADRSKAASQLTTLLPEKERSLVGYSYFSRAIDNEGNLNPGKLSTLINNLGKNQFKALVPDYIMRNQLKNYDKLYKMNIKAVNLLQNPATGQQSLDILPILAAMGGAKQGGISGALAGMLIPGIAAKPIVKAMTSPKIREALVNAIINYKPWNKSALPVIQTGAQGTLNQQ